MLDQVFIYGTKYTGQAKELEEFSRLFTGAYRASLYPVYVSLFSTLLLFRKNRWKIILLIWISTAATLIAIAISGRNFEHYYALLIPLVALDVWFIWYAFRDVGWRQIAAVICGMGFVLSYEGTYLLDRNSVDQSIMTEHGLSSEMAIIDVSEHISDNGSVYCWTSQPRWYMYANKFPSFRYCGWQTDQMDIDPSVGEALSDMFMNNPPQWLVLSNNNNMLPKFVVESKERYFDEAYRNQYWILYCRDDK